MSLQWETWGCKLMATFTRSSLWKWLDLSLGCEFPRVSSPFHKLMHLLLRLRQLPSGPRWFEDFEEHAYHYNSSSLSSSDPEEAAGPPRKSIVDFLDFLSAESAVWKTLATILPRAAPLPALGSLLKHLFAEPTKYSFFSEERKDATAASLKYLEVKLFA